MPGRRYYPYELYEVPIQEFYGGQASDEAIGTAASFSHGQALEHRRNPSRLTVLPGPRKISAGVVQDLILNIQQVVTGERYCLGDQGYVYKIDTSNLVTNFGKLPTGSDGLVYRSDIDALYMATQTEIRRAYPMSNNPRLDVTYGASKSIDTAAYRTGGQQIYTVPTVIDESQACHFQPDIEPFYSNKVNVVTKGTGNVTLTLHDGLNNTLATSTVAAATMATGLKEFLYSSQVRGLVKPNARTYHFHLTSTVADTTVACATAGQLDTADFELWAYRLVDTNNGFHPMIQFQQFICIGNGNYLAVWEPLSDTDPPNNEFQRHRLTFPAGFEVCGVAVTDEFLVIACEKYSTNGTKDFQEGKLFIWDGVSKTYNQVVDVSGGSPGAIQSHENYPYFYVNGALCAWGGGRDIIKVRTINNTDSAYRDAIDNTRVYPNMMTVRDNLLHCAYPSFTTNLSLEHGVHTWGSLEKNYAASWGNLNYVISTQTTLNTSGNLQLGCVRNFGDEMYLSWKDDKNGYGLDIVDSYCDPAPVFKFRARQFNAGQVFRDKQAIKVSIVTAALPSGVTITPVTKVDDAAEKSNESVMSAGDSILVAAVPRPNVFKRIVYGFDGTCSGTQTPIIYCSTLQYNPLMERQSL